MLSQSIEKKTCATDKCHKGNLHISMLRGFLGRSYEVVVETRKLLPEILVDGSQSQHQVENGRKSIVE